MSTAPAGAIPSGYTDHDADRRWLKDGPDPDDYRMRFGRDYDRLVHTSAFRRLQGKTQVVTPGEADFFRTRLTHTIEVAQVARRLAEKIKANPELCEAAAVLHDLGHPPFGHVGEVELGKALDETAEKWRIPPSEVGGFNGNAQSFRLAVKTLSQSDKFDGLDLTRAVLDGAVKYPWQRHEPLVAESGERWCFFPTEAAEAAWVRDAVPPEREFEKSLEAEIVEWADDVAYSIHDLEDWYRAGYMPLEMLAQSDDFRAEFSKHVSLKVKDSKLAPTEVEAVANEFFGGEVFRAVTRSYNGSDDVKKAIRAMRKQLFTEFMEVGLEEKAAPPKRHENTLKIDDQVRLHNRILRRLLWDFVIEHPRMATHQMGQARVVKELFELHIEALAFDEGAGAIDLKKAKLDIYPPDMRGRLRDDKTPPEGHPSPRRRPDLRNDGRLRSAPPRPAYGGSPWRLQRLRVGAVSEIGQQRDLLKSHP